MLRSGDFAGHSLSPQDQEYAITTVMQTWIAAFPNTTLIPAVGNNDVCPNYAALCQSSR